MGKLSSRRSAARVSRSIENQETVEGRPGNAALAQGYRTKVEAEMQEICDEVVSLIKDNLLSKAETGEARAFLLKMQGDYHRYITEITLGDQSQAAADEAERAYTDAMREANDHLLTTHPVRLGIALNFSVFQHEVLGQAQAAIATAQAAVRSAAADFDSMPEEAIQGA